MIRNRTMPWVTIGALLLAAACGKEAPQKVAQAFQAASSAPDEVPKMLNTELPFRYPAALYARKVQGNVTLRLHVDSSGRVRPESTSIVTSSGFSALDSAAVHGAAALRFAPAVRDGRAVGRSIRFPVLFRHPAAPPLPGDTVLRR
jgi:protein TonB